ncbi:MAG: hypothetical protein ABSC64_02450 [Candidatus Korobacteraceae bacterium]
MKEDKDTQVRFLEGPLWKIDATRHEGGVIESRIYHLVNHHVYVIRTLDAGVDSDTFYIQVSGRGNVNEISRENALEVVGLRTGYVEDYDFHFDEPLPPLDNPAYTCGDW